MITTVNIQGEGKNKVSSDSVFGSREGLSCTYSTNGTVRPSANILGEGEQPSWVFGQQTKQQSTKNVG